MIVSPWIALALGAGIASACMTVLWIVQVGTRDATLVDIGWAYEIGIVGVVYAIVADGAACHRILVGVLAAVWSLRLGTYLVVDRLFRHEGEDGRYRDLRRRWTERGISVNLWFFVFFQAQAALVLWFTVPMLLTSFNPSEASSRSRSRTVLFAVACTERALHRSCPATTRATGAGPAAPASGTTRGTRTTSSSGCSGSAGP